MTFPPGDDILVAEARSGSSEAFGILIARHQGAVRGFLRRLTGNHADADDLAQEVFVTAWSRLSDYRGEAALRVWLCGIAWRKAQSYRRSEGRRTLREETSVREAAPAADSCPATTLDLARAFAALPLDQRASLALCLAAGFTHEEAGAALGIPLGTIKSHVTRGRAKLMERLGGGDD